MTTVEKLELLDRVRAALAKKKSPMLILEDIEQILEEGKCFCGRWRRGGGGKGSGLCEQCYSAD